MAKKEETMSLLDTFQEFKESKNIDRTTMISVLEESFRKVIINLFGTDENYSVIVNPDRGDFEIQRRRTVVADSEVKDSNFEISLSEAQLIDDTFEEGEEVSEIVNFAEFGRRAILNLRQTLASKILELEKDSLYNKYSEKIGQIVSAEVYDYFAETLLEYADHCCAVDVLRLLEFLKCIKKADCFVFLCHFYLKFIIYFVYLMPS